MTHKAVKIVIITEKVIFDGVVEVINAAGASGYTMVEAGGKGSRGIRNQGRAIVVDALRNVKALRLFCVLYLNHSVSFVACAPFVCYAFSL